MRPCASCCVIFEIERATIALKRDPEKWPRRQDADIVICSPDSRHGGYAIPAEWPLFAWASETPSRAARESTAERRAGINRREKNTQSEQSAPAVQSSQSSPQPPARTASRKHGKCVAANSPRGLTG
jgi:hypothetical protein